MEEQKQEEPPLNNQDAAPDQEVQAEEQQVAALNPAQPPAENAAVNAPIPGIVIDFMQVVVLDEGYEEMKFVQDEIISSEEANLIPEPPKEPRFCISPKKAYFSQKRELGKIENLREGAAKDPDDQADTNVAQVLL